MRSRTAPQPIFTLGPGCGGHPVRLLPERSGTVGTRHGDSQRKYMAGSSRRLVSRALAHGGCRSLVAVEGVCKFAPPTGPGCRGSRARVGSSVLHGASWSGVQPELCASGRAASGWRLRLLVDRHGGAHPRWAWEAVPRAHHRLRRAGTASCSATFGQPCATPWCRTGECRVAVAWPSRATRLRRRGSLQAAEGWIG